MLTIRILLFISNWLDRLYPHDMDESTVSAIRAFVVSVTQEYSAPILGRMKKLNKPVPKTLEIASPWPKGEAYPSKMSLLTLSPQTVCNIRMPD